MKSKIIFAGLAIEMAEGITISQSSISVVVADVSNLLLVISSALVDTTCDFESNFSELDS